MKGHTFSIETPSEGRGGEGTIFQRLGQGRERGRGGGVSPEGNAARIQGEFILEGGSFDRIVLLSKEEPRLPKKEGVASWLGQAALGGKGRAGEKSRGTTGGRFSMVI